MPERRACQHPQIDERYKHTDYLFIDILTNFRVIIYNDYVRSHTHKCVVVSLSSLMRQWMEGN